MGPILGHLLDGVSVKRSSATFEIVAQNSANKEASLEFGDFGWGLAVLWCRASSWNRRREVAVDVFVVLSSCGKEFFCG